MEDEQNDSLVFRSDDIPVTQSHKNKNNYFVRVIKDPLLRLILRAKPPKTPKQPPQPAPKPSVKSPEPPKPQLRTTIRISTLKLKNPKSRHSALAIILSFLVGVLSTLVIVFLYHYFYPFSSTSSPVATMSDSEVAHIRQEMLDVIGVEPIYSEGIEHAIADMDSQINTAPPGEARQSLKIYKVSLLINKGYLAEALQYFETIERETFTDAQLCELYGYRLQLSQKTGNQDGDADYQAKYNTACHVAPADQPSSTPQDNTEPPVETEPASEQPADTAPQE